MNKLSILTYRNLIPPIVFGVIGYLVGATIFVIITMIIGKISWFFSIISGMLGGISVGFGAKFSDFKSIKMLKFLGIIIGFVSVLLGYYFLYKWLIFETFREIGVTGVPSFHSFLGNPLDTFFAFFLGGLCGGYIGFDFFMRFSDSNEKLKYEKSIEEHYFLGVSYEKKGLYNDAEKEYLKAIELNPEHYKAYCNLGTVYSKTGRTEEAIKYYKRALQINPKDSITLLNLGRIYFVSVDEDEGLEYFSKAIDVDLANRQKVYQAIYFYSYHPNDDIQKIEDKFNRLLRETFFKEKNKN